MIEYIRNHCIFRNGSPNRTTPGLTNVEKNVDITTGDALVHDSTMFIVGFEHTHMSKYVLNFSVRVILFGLVWAVTFGKHHLWIFPNLTEDVGIIESFMPLYQHDVVSRGGNEEEKSDDATGSSNTDTQASAEAEASVASNKQEAGQIASGAEQEASQASGDDREASEEQQNIEPVQEALDNAGEGNESENSSGGSKHSLGDEYEMVEPDEVKAEQDP